jgi:hypothetical protein
MQIRGAQSLASMQPGSMRINFLHVSYRTQAWLISNTSLTNLGYQATSVRNTRPVNDPGNCHVSLCNYSHDACRRGRCGVQSWNRIPKSGEPVHAKNWIGQLSKLDIARRTIEATQRQPEAN